MKRIIQDYFYDCCSLLEEEVDAEVECGVGVEGHEFFSDFAECVVHA